MQHLLNPITHFDARDFKNLIFLLVVLILDEVSIFPKFTLINSLIILLISIRNSSKGVRFDILYTEIEKNTLSNISIYSAFN